MRIKVIVSLLAAAALSFAVFAGSAAAAIGDTPITWTKLLPNGKTLTHPGPGTAMSVGGDPTLESVVPSGNTTCWANSARNASLVSDFLHLPVGATLTGFTANWYDVSSAPPSVGEPDLLVTIWKRVPGIPDQGVASVWSSGNGGFGSTTSAAVNETVDVGESFFVTSILPISQGNPTEAGLCSLDLNLQLGN
jgi:hypothetical protein